MYVTYVTYVLIIGLLLWGGKFAGFRKNKFHEDCISLEVTKSLRGFAAIGVILHHISQQNAFQGANGWEKPGELSIFVNFGFKLVAIFFFCSGFGLLKSLKTKENYLDGFIKKRILKTIVVPFYVNVILYGIFYVICGMKMPLAHWITNFLGLTLMNEYAWYPIVLTILYFAFYFIFKNVKNRKIAFTIMFVIIFLQGVFFCITGHFAWWAGPKNWWLSPNAAATAKWWMQNNIIWFFGEWWVNSSIAFLVGLIFAEYEEKILSWFKKLYWLKLLIIFVIYNGFNYLSGFAQWKFGYWSEYNGTGPGILNKFICYCSQLPQVITFVILLFVILMKYHAQNPVSRFFGNVSYETYMMNLIPITVFEFILYNSKGLIVKTGHWNLAVYEVAVLVTTILLGLLFKWLNKQANKLIK